MSAASGVTPGGQAKAEARAIATLPDAAWGPIAVGSVLGTDGLIGLAAGQPWLFPSLGPTAFLHAETPARPPSRFYNTVVGHLVGMAAGMAAVWLLGAATAPGVLASHELAPTRVGAAVLAAVLTMVGLSLLKASHPPAAATMLLVALGAFEPSARSAGVIVVGVVIVAVLGEAVGYIRLHWLPAPTG